MAAANDNGKYARLVTDALVFIMGTVLTKLVQFALMPLYTTYMTTRAYGAAELTNNASELLFPIVTLCVYEAAFRFVIGSDSDSKRIFSAATGTVLVSALIGIPVTAIVAAATKYAYAWHLYFVLYAFSFRTLAAYYARGKGYVKTFAASGVLNAVILAAFTYLFIVILKMDSSGYLLAIGSAYVGSFAFLFCAAKLREDLTFPPGTVETLKAELAYSTPLIAYNVGYWLTTMSGRYVILWSMGESAAGEYAAVIKLAAVVNMAQQAFYAAFQLNAARAFDDAGKEEFYSRIFRLYSAGILSFGSAVLACSPILAKITLKGDFYEARGYLPIVLLVAIVDCAFCFFKTMYTTYKLTKRAVPSMAFGAVVNVVVGVATVGRYGIWGICVASFACYAIQAAYRVIDVRSFVKIKCSWPSIVAALAIMLVEAIVLARETKGSIAIAWACVAVTFAIQAASAKPDVAAFLKRRPSRNEA